jgi:flagellar biosynthesis protein FlhF
MRIKRFQGKDLPAVVALIKEEFGLEAIILSQRAALDGGVEVTAGVRDEDLPKASKLLLDSQNDFQKGNQAPADNLLSSGQAAALFLDADDFNETARPQNGAFDRVLSEEAVKPEVSAADLLAVLGNSRKAESPQNYSPPIPAPKPKVKARPLDPVSSSSNYSSNGVRLKSASSQSVPNSNAVKEAVSSPNANQGGASSPDATPSGYMATVVKAPRGSASGSASGVASGTASGAANVAARGEARGEASGEGRGEASGETRGDARGEVRSSVDKLVSNGASINAAHKLPSPKIPPGAQGSDFGGQAKLTRPMPKPMTPPAAGAAAYRRVQASPSDNPSRELELLREQMGENFGELKNLLMDLAHRQSLSEKWRDRPDLVGLYRSLLTTGLSGDWARDFVEKSADSLEAWGGELDEHLRRTVRPLIRCLSAQTPLPKLVAVTGPSGSGKTTTLVRLAAFCQKRGQKVSAITLDTLKLGAAEQLSQYARIMGLGLKACQNRQQFTEALEIFEDSDVVLVDTNTRDFGVKAGAFELNQSVPASSGKFLLVLPVGLKSEDLSWFHSRLAGPDLLGLVFTKFDESRNIGNVMNFLAAHGPPLAFFSHGPRTPEDFQPAKSDRLIDFWLSGLNISDPRGSG